MRLAERLEHEKQPEKSLEMRKSLIAAAAGVLASTFMVLGTPAASAGPCAVGGSVNGPGWGTQACGDCIKQQQAAGVIDSGPACSGGDLNQNDLACKQAGRCG